MYSAMRGKSTMGCCQQDGEYSEHATLTPLTARKIYKAHTTMGIERFDAH